MHHYVSWIVTTSLDCNRCPIIQAVPRANAASSPTQRQNKQVMRTKPCCVGRMGTACRASVQFDATLQNNKYESVANGCRRLQPQPHWQQISHRASIGANASVDDTGAILICNSCPKFSRGSMQRWPQHLWMPVWAKHPYGDCCLAEHKRRRRRLAAANMHVETCVAALC